MEKRNCENCGHYNLELRGCMSSISCRYTYDARYTTLWTPREPKNCEQCDTMNCNDCQKG